MIDTTEIRAQVPYAMGWGPGTIIALCDEIDRLRAPKQQSQGRTVDVRVAVAVDKCREIEVEVER